MRTFILRIKGLAKGKMRSRNLSKIAWEMAGGQRWNSGNAEYIKHPREAYGCQFWGKVIKSSH